MIRNSLYKTIVQTLDNSNRFESTDFTIQSEVTYNYTNLKILYNYDDRYYIEFSLPKELSKDINDTYNYSISGKACPGPFALNESFNFRGSKNILVKISEWVINLWEELSSEPIIRNVNRKSDEINEILEKFTDVENVHFTQSEVSELKNKLDALEKKIIADYEDFIDDKKQLQKDIDDLHQDIETLKQTVNSLKKQGWLKSFTTKAVKWVSKDKNRKMLSDGYSVVREFLPEEIKGGLPDIKK